MKIEKIKQTTSSDTVSFLSLALLLRHMGDELCVMAKTCRNVENALGVVIGKPEKPVDDSIIAIQGLDKMRQTLEDLARLTKAISNKPVLTSVEVRTRDIRKVVVLAGLVENLSVSGTRQIYDGDDESDVLWM